MSRRNDPRESLRRAGCWLILDLFLEVVFMWI